MKTHRRVAASERITFSHSAVFFHSFGLVVVAGEFEDLATVASVAKAKSLKRKNTQRKRKRVKRNFLFLLK